MARVIGTVVATVKNPTIEGTKILVLKNIDARRRTYGRAFVAFDSVGCGIGEEVYYVRGREACFPFLPEEVPSDTTIVGIIDRIYGSER
ncbi:MAG: EutN/CcmL family microcompartment protein [Acidobacteria bacterium]|nr:EutN/CcmL family microcompartment protein [Acidobacteriota bacterium]